MSRLEELLSYRCGCGHNGGDNILEYVQDGCDNTMTLKGKLCGKRYISTPGDVPTGTSSAKRDVYKTTNGIIYLSIIDGFRLAGVNRMLGILGMQTMGTGKFYRYLRHNYGEMNSHYDNMQSRVMQAVRDYYEKYTTNIPDKDGILNIDISYDGTWLKRAFLPCGHGRRCRSMHGLYCRLRSDA